MADVLSYKLVEDVRDQYISTDGFQRFFQILNELRKGSAEDSDIVKRTRGLLAQALKKAHQEGITNIASQLRNNERHAEKALRTYQYSKRSGNVGAYVSLLRPRRNGSIATRPVPPTKSGRERNWSDRTKQVYGYQGEDAQFILYWLTQGTSERQSGTGRANSKTGRYGNRSTSDARKRYFGGSHNVGRINPNTINPQIVEIFTRIVNGEIIPGIDEIVQDIMNDNK